MTITAKSNPKLKAIAALLSDHRQRKKQQKTVLEGIHLLISLHQSGQTANHVVVSDRYGDYPEIVQLIKNVHPSQLLVISDRLYTAIRTLGEGPPIMAVIDIPKPPLKPLTGDCLIVDGVADSGNLGTLLRTAAATGFCQVVCTKGSASAWSPKTLRAAMGAHFSLTIYEHVDPTALLSQLNIPLLATSSHSQTPIFYCDLTAAVAVVVGHEGQGVSPALMAHATCVSLPQLGQESLNVGVAGSICLYEILRQRQYPS